MRALEIKENTTRVKVMLYLFLLIFSFLSTLTNVMAQSVSVDYCVLENLGSAPNVPSTLLGKAAPLHNNKKCTTKTFKNPDQDTHTKLNLSKTYQPALTKTRRAPKFPIIRDGRFVPPAGQIGLVTRKKQQDLSLLSPPKSKKKRIFSKKASQSSKFSPEKKTPSSARLPSKRMKTPIDVSKSKKTVSTDKSQTKKFHRKQETKKSISAAVSVAPRVPNAPVVNNQKKDASKFANVPVSKAPTKKTPVAVATLEPTIPKTEIIRQIKFSFGSAKIETDSELSLKVVSKKLKSDPTLRIQLMAYASIDGKSESQARRLSLSRALAVRSRLIGAGLRSTRIDVRALGSRVKGGKANRVDLLLKRR